MFTIPAVDEKADLLLSTARAYVSRHSSVAHVSYRVVVSLTSGNAIVSRRTYDSAFDGASRVVYANSISEEEPNHPIVPHGINVVISASASTSTGSTGGTGISLGRPLDEKDVIGAPVLTPSYFFGLARPPEPQADALGGSLRTIVQTKVVNREYYASYLGDETVAGEPCAHLRLISVTHPEKHRLREVWVASDGAPLQAIIHGNFTTRPWDGLDWTITFRRDAAALFIDSETTQESVRIDKLRKGRVSISFQDVIADAEDNRFLLHLEPYNAVREPN